MPPSAATSVLEGINDAVQYFMERTGRNAQAVQQGLAKFLDEIKPDVAELLAEQTAGSRVAAESLELFADATVARAARLGLELTEGEKLALAAIIGAGVRAALAVLVTAA